MSIIVSGTINGIPLTFNPKDDWRNVAVQENVRVTIALTYPPLLGKPHLYVDELPIDVRRVEESYTEWEWLSGDAAGLYEVDFRVGNRLFRSGLKVIPSKLSLEQYRRMTLEVESLAAALHFDFFGRGAIEPTALGSFGPRDLAGEYRVLVEQGTRFWQLASDILRDPDMDLVRTNRPQRIGAIGKVDGSGWPPVLRATLAQHTLEGTEPVFSQSVVEAGYDTHENRYVRYVLTTLIARLARFRTRLHDEIARSKHLRRLFAGEYPDRPEEKRRFHRLAEMQRGAMLLHDRLMQLEQRSWLKGLPAGQPTPTLRMMSMPAYREVHQLARRLVLSEGIASVVDARRSRKRAVKPIQSIYEIWCYLAIATSLHMLGAVVTPPQAITQEIQEYRIRLKIKEGTFITFLWGEGEGRLIWMPRIAGHGTRAPEYQSSGGDPLTPDMILELEFNDGRRQFFILDAKYRKNPNGTHRPEDIEKALYYYHHILPKPGFSKAGSWILFAGSQAQDFGFVKAIPLTPGQDNHLLYILRKTLGITDTSQGVTSPSEG